MLSLDTHIIVHALTGSLTRRETELLEQNELGYSPVVLWELAMLASRGRIALNINSGNLLAFLNHCAVLDLTLAIAIQATNLDFRSDPMDEIIAATSIAYDSPLITRDERILKSKIVPLAV